MQNTEMNTRQLAGSILRTLYAIAERHCCLLLIVLLCLAVTAIILMVGVGFYTTANREFSAFARKNS